MLGFVYEVLGLVTALRVKGHTGLPETGEVGLTGRILSDLRAETALVYWLLVYWVVLVGVVGGDQRDGEARGMMSRGSEYPAE